MEVNETTADPGETPATPSVSNTSIFIAPNVILTADYRGIWVTVVDPNGAVDNGDTLAWRLNVCEARKPIRWSRRSLWPSTRDWRQVFTT